MTAATPYTHSNLMAIYTSMPARAYRVAKEACRRNCAPTLGPTTSTLRIAKLPRTNPLFIKTGEASAVLGVAHRHQALRQLVVAISGRRPQQQRIFLDQVASQRILANRIEIEFAVRGRAKSLVQRVQNRLLPSVQRLVSLAFFIQTNHDIVLRSGTQHRVANRLNRAVRQSGCGQSFANLVNRRRAGESHIHQRAAAEVDSVLDAAVLQDGGPAGDEQNCRKGDKILRLAHPVDVDVFKKFHSDTYPPLFDTVCRINVPASAFASQPPQRETATS